MSTNIEQRLQCSSILDVHNRLIQCHINKQNSLTKCDEYLLRKNHKFLWDDTKSELSWEEELAKKYYDKLFKEFCICDLSKYKENKVALRWRSKTEVISGKGQFICADRKCECKERLRTWEVNFCYQEDNERKNALVKIKLCIDCSDKLNYRSKKREVKRLKNKHKKKKSSKREEKQQAEPINSQTEEASSSTKSKELEEKPWTQKHEVEIKSREEEMDDYLNDLLF